MTSQAISYSYGYTAIDAAGTTVTVAPPPLYSAGDLLVMGVIGGGTTGNAVSAATPSGWTLQGSSGASPAIFTKTATSSEPSSYTVTLSATATIAAFVAAFPTATVVSSAFHSSGSDIVSYAPAFPSGVTSGQTVLLVAAAVAASGDVNGNAGGQNVVYPAGWNTEVPVFGQSLPGASGVYPCAIGLSSVQGSVSSPALTSPQGCGIWAGYLVLNITGTPPAPFSVTATSNVPEGLPGLALTVKALSGAASVPAITSGGAKLASYASGTSQAPQALITPNGTGSYIYGAVTQNAGVTGGTTYTAVAGTTFSQNAGDSAWNAIYGTFRSAGTTTAGTAVTLGGSAPSNPYTTAALAEILAAPGKSLSETATATALGTVPGDFPTTAVTRTAYFTSAPAPGTLLVAMVSANSNWSAGNASVTITDSSGLTWVKLAEQTYPSYSGVWIAGVSATGTAPFPLPVRPVRGRQAARRGASAGSAGAPWAYVAPPAPQVLDEAGADILDEAGADLLDERGASVPAPFALPVSATAPHRSARKGASQGSQGAPWVYVKVPVAPFTLPVSSSPRHPSARRGSSRFSPGAPYVFVKVPVAPFTLPVSAVPPHPSARRGSSQGSQGAPYAYVPPAEDFDVLDESGAAVLDESGADVEDESAPYPVAGTLTWTAARAGMPHDATAVNYPDQVSQFLLTHGVRPVYRGTLIWEPAVTTGSVQNSFGWLGSSTSAWLPAADVSQPFTLALTSTTVGRVEVPLLATGTGADLRVTLCPDNGSGAPNLSSPLATAVIPASHITALTAGGSLTAAGPLATAQSNASLIGPYETGPWSQPAVSANGAGSYATPATTGNYTVLIGGYDSVAGAATGNVNVIAFDGTGVSGGTVQPSLPQPAWYTCAAITTDSVVVAGGRNTSTVFASVWTAPWDGSGTVGAWSAQQALPAPVMYGTIAAWGTQVYVIGGSPDGTAANAVSAVRTASAQSGQVTAWTACPPLPQPLMQAYAAVIGNWLVVAGGVNTSGSTVTSTWYTAINSDGSLAGWQQGPLLPQPVAAFAPGWNQAVTDSAMTIVAGYAGGTSFSPYTQVLAVSPDGPAPLWRVQYWQGSSGGAFQAGAYPSGPSGQWQLVNLHTTSYDSTLLGPVTHVSVPLPATGLTPGATYHVVLRQSGGSLASSLQAGAVTSGGTALLYSPRGSGGPWTAAFQRQVAVNVYDQTAGGTALHLTEDNGARTTTLIREGAGGLLTGVLEAVTFPAGAPEAVLGTVTQVTWTGGLPSGLTVIA